MRLARLASSDHKFLVIISVELGGGVLEWRITENKQATPPCKRIHQFRGSLPGHEHRTPRDGYDVSRRQQDGFGVHRIEPRFSFRQLHLKPSCFAADQKFRSEIGNTMRTRKHHERMRGVMLDLKVGLAPLQDRLPALSAQDRFGIQLDARTVSERHDAVAT